jgi:hypothetical protein
MFSWRSALARHDLSLPPTAMLPTVYFPELRLDKAFVPAHLASKIEAGGASASRDAAGEMLRIENHAASHATRRRPTFEPTVLDA